MANTVDERIVEARFDSKDFEQGVDRTIKKLDELKQSLNMKDSGKSVADFASDAEKGLEKAGNALERLSNRFTTFTGMLKQQILTGLVNEISQAFITLEQRVAGFVRSISSAQVGQGMNKYTEILNSVRTMTAAGVDQDIAYDKIKRLAEYSDQTSYSLSQMTSGMSKLVAAGMDVDKAEKSMEGLANMAASAGVNIYEAQRAFINFSQAYSSGKMRIQDWTSFETLNMATEPVMKIFMEAAAQVGTLEKTVDKGGKEIYKTSKKVNKQIKAGKEVATSGFRDTLSYGWLDKATMEQATAVLSYFEDLGVDLNELSDEDLKKFATKAFQAAKEARSFADVMGTVKDVVATGWATSFELIFGKLEKATEFFTWLTESNLAEVIYSIGEFRNAVLKAWGADYLEGGIFHAKDEEKGYLGTGRDMLIDALKNIDELIGSIHEGIQSLFPEANVGWMRNLTFAEKIGYNLAMVTKRFRAATKTMLDFFTVEEEHNGEKKRVLRPEYLKVLETVGKIFSVIGKAAGAAFGIIGKLAGIIGKTFARLITTVQPVLDAIAGALGRIFDPISQLNENEGFFKSIQNAIDNLLIVIEPLMGPLSAFIGLLGELGSFFVSMAIDTIAMNIDLLAQSLGFIIELFGGTSAQKANEGVGVIEGWTNDIKAFGESCKEGFTAIKDFFTSLFNDLKVLLGIGEKTEGQEGGFFDNIKNFFDTNEFVQKVKAWIDQAIIDIGNWIKGIPAKVSEFATNIGDFFHGLFWMKDENDPSKEVMTPLNAWFTQAIADVKAFILDLPKKITDGIKNVGSFFEQLWNSLFYEEKVDKYGKKIRVKKPLKEWLDQALVDVRSFIKKIPEYVKAGIKGAGNILRTLIGALFGKKDGEDVTGSDIINTLKRPFEGITFTSILTKIKEIGREIANQIISLFTGTDDWESNKNTLATSVSSGIDWIRTKAEEAWTSVKDWFIHLPETISNVIQSLFGIGDETEKPIQEAYDKYGKLVDESFTGEKYDKYGKKIEEAKSPIQIALEDFGKSVGGFIADLPSVILGFVNTAITEVGKLWDMLWKALRGEGEPQAELDENGKVVEKAVNEAAPDAKKATSKWEEFTTSLGETVSNLFSKLPTFITQGLDGAVILINKALTGLNGLLEADNAEQEAKKKGKDGANGVVEAAAEGTEDADAKALTEAMYAFGSDLKSLISDKIPTFISKGWTAVKNHAPEWWGIVNTWFDGYDISGLTSKVTEIGERIEGVIRGMPDLISTAAEWVKKKFEKKSPLQKAQEEITKSLTDKNGNIIDVNAYRYAMKQAAETLSDIPEESAIWTSIKGIGSAIGDALGKVGPDILDGLNNAFKWIGDKVVDFTGKLKEKPDDKPFFEWLTGLIGGENGDNGETSAIAESVKNIGETLKNLIVNIIPNFLGEAFAEIAAGVPRFIQSIFGGGSSSEAESAGKEAGTEMGEQFGNGATQAMVSGFQGALEKNSASLGSGTDVLSWFTGLFVGTAQAEDSEGSGDSLDIIIDNGKKLINKQEKINEISKKLNDARADLENAEALEKNDEIDELTKNIEAYEAQLKILNEAEGEFVDAKILDNAPKAQEGMEKISFGLLGFLDIFKNLTGAINGFANSNVLGTVTIVAGIIYVLHALKDMLSITDEVEGIGYAAKWEAIKIAIMGIVGLIAYMIGLSITGNEEQLNNIERVFDKVVDVLKHLAGVFTIIKALKFGSSVFDMIGTVRGAGGIGKAVGGAFGKGAGMILGGVTAVGIGGDILTEALSNWSGNLTETFEKIGIGMDDLVKAVEDLASIGDKIDAAKESIKRISELFAELREIFVEDVITPAEESGTGAETVSKRNFTGEFMDIIKMFIQLSGAVAQFKTAITTYGANTTGVTDALSSLLGMKDSMKEFGEFATSDAFSDFKLALMSIGSALQFYSLANVDDLNKPLKNWQIENAVALLKQMFGNNQLQELVEAAAAPGVFTDSKFDEKELLDNAEHLVIFAGALSAIGNACQELNESDTGNINTLFSMVQGINLPEGDDISTFAQQFGILGNALGTFAIETSGLTDTNVKTAGTALDMLLRIAQGLKDIPNDSVLAKAFAGDKTLEAFGVGVQALGGNLKAFFEAIQNLNSAGESVEYNRKNTEQVLMAIDALSQAAVRIGKVSYVNDALKNADSWLAAALGSLGGFGTNIMKFIDEINSYNTTDNKAINFDFVYSAIDAIGKLTLYMDKVSNLGSIETKVKNVGELLIGNGTSHNGVMGWLNQFFAKVIDITQRDKVQFDLKTTTDVITAYATMVTQIVDLIKEIHAKDENLLGVGDTTNPMEYLIPVFSSVNDNYGVFETFLDNASKFNQEGILKAQGFFGALHDLATGLFIFSQQDSNGDFNVLKGLSTLMNFNWESLTSVKDNMVEIFKSDEFSSLGLTAGQSFDKGIAEGINTGLAISAAQQLADAIEAAINDQDIHPKITPVIEIDDETMKTLELFDQNGTGTFRFSTSGMSNDASAANPNLYGTIPDYSEILNTISGTLSTISGSSTTTVETSLEGVQVVMDTGAVVGALIGEIDTILARRGFYADREG